MHTEKVRTKNVNISRTKKVFNMKENAFFIIAKGLSIVRNCPESGPLRAPSVILKVH